MPGIAAQGNEEKLLISCSVNTIFSSTGRIVYFKNRENSSICLTNDMQLLQSDAKETA